MRLEARIDPDAGVYPSGLHEPTYTRCSPGDLHDLRELALRPRADVHSLVGCGVTVTGFGNPESLLVISQSGDGGRTISSPERLLVPLAGTDRAFWAVSLPFRRRDHEGKSAWIRKDRFTGRLGRFEDLRTNLVDLRNSPESIAEVYREEFGVPVPDGALVVLPEPDEGDGIAPGRGRFFPVEGSGHSLFLRLGDDEEAGPGPTLDGVLRPLDDEDLRELASALGVPAAASGAVLEPMSADEYNERQSRSGGLWFHAGLFLILLAIYLTFHKHRAFRRERREVDAEVEKQMGGEGALRKPPEKKPAEPKASSLG